MFTRVFGSFLDPGEQQYPQTARMGPNKSGAQISPWLFEQPSSWMLPEAYVPKFGVQCSLKQCKSVGSNLLTQIHCLHAIVPLWSYVYCEIQIPWCPCHTFTVCFFKNSEANGNWRCCLPVSLCSWLYFTNLQSVFFYTKVQMSHLIFIK